MVSRKYFYISIFISLNIRSQNRNFGIWDRITSRFVYNFSRDKNSHPARMMPKKGYSPVLLRVFAHHLLAGGWFLLGITISWIYILMKRPGNRQNAFFIFFVGIICSYFTLNNIIVCIQTLDFNSKCNRVN